MKIPQRGLSKEEIFQTLKSHKGADLDWKSGRVFGCIYMRRLGYDMPDFNMNVPGVTSLSVDLHKYGYAAKGASMTVEEMKQEEIDQETRDLLAELKKLSLGFDEKNFFKLAEMAGVTGVAPPERMERVNMLLEALPCDVSEFMLTEYLNNMMLLDGDAH